MTIQISMTYTRGHSADYLPRELKMPSIRAWTAMIDRALAPRKPAKGYKRPVFDPEADAQTPPTWHYTLNGRD